METQDKRFEISVTKEGDSVVSIGNIFDVSFKSTYYGEYEEALDAIRDQCKSFVEAHKEDKNEIGN